MQVIDKLAKADSGWKDANLLVLLITFEVKKCQWKCFLFINIWLASQFELASFTETHMTSDHNLQLFGFHPHALRTVTAAWL